MEKVNIFSVFLFNLFRGLSKKYLLFFFMTVAILLCYGFSFTRVSAEEDVPGEENVPFIEVSEDITEDTIWSEISKPYVVTSSIEIGVNEEGVKATLTIGPGVVVKFMPDTDLYITGKIIADGTKDPIYFTSNYDDTLGGSTDEDWYSCDYEDYVLDENGDFLKDENGDYILDEEGDILGIGEEICEYIDYYDPYSGDWGGIDFQSSNNSELKNVFFRYADEALSFESSNVEINNLNISDGVSGMTGYNNSSIKIVNGNINNLEGDAFTFFNNSSLDLKNIKIENVWNGFTLFNDSSLDISGGKLTHNGTGFEIFNNVTANISNFEIDGGDIGIEIFNGSTLNLKNSVIKNASYAGLESFSGEDEADNNISISKSEITKNGYGLVLNNSVLSVSQNSIHDNIVGASTWSPDLGFDLKNNFWGEKTGPKNETSNPTGIGNEIADNILFTPFLKYDPTKETKNPVIIVPGIMGTELIRDYGDNKDEIWPAISKVILSIYDNYLRELELLPNGDENLDFPMKTRDIIREVPSTNIFNGLVSELESNGEYKEGENLFVFPYDWRYSNVKNAELLKEKIDQVLADTEKDKVDIVAHSMGGLLTKEYIKENRKDKIDHLIFLGTPHLGAPKAYKALIYGDDMGFKKLGIPLLSSKIVKAISQNMPSIYELLPSRKYVSSLRYISEKTIGSDPVYFDYDATKNLLIQKKVNQSMLESADTFHQGIEGIKGVDDIDLSGIKVSNISACGEATLSAIDIRKEVNIGPIKFKEDYKLSYANGDSTVPLDSSFGISNVDKYFVDKISHSALPSALDVPDAVLSILENKTRKIDSSVFTDINNCTPIHGYILSIHSPISLDIYDANGNHSGLDADGNIESNIEGVSYDTIGDAKFAFIPDGLNVSVKGSATGSGTFDLAIEKVVNGETTETKFWNDVPITSTSQMNFDFSSYSNTNSIEIDNNGNKKIIINSNVLSQNEDYLAVPAKIIETKKQNTSGGSYIIKNNSKIVVNVPNIEIKKDTLPDIVKNIDILKQKPIKKSLAIFNKKQDIIKKEVINKNLNLGASVINAGQDIDFWGTIRLFFRRLFHIKK